jgi:hypothetical protein
VQRFLLGKAAIFQGAREAPLWYYHGESHYTTSAKPVPVHVQAGIYHTFPCAVLFQGAQTGVDCFFHENHGGASFCAMVGCDSKCGTFITTVYVWPGTVVPMSGSSPLKATTVQLFTVNLDRDYGTEQCLR